MKTFDDATATTREGSGHVRRQEERWYHTIELPTGPTPGEYDLRRSVDKILFPATLAGRRCLDVGTHDGFWAFEMERRGATDVVAIDIRDPEEIDWPEPRPVIDDALREAIADRKEKFRIAHEALGSSISHTFLSVYDLTPEAVGEFDFVHIGSLLQHLRDPIGALMAIRRVTRGQLVVSASFAVGLSVWFPRSPLTVVSRLTGQPFWQVPNLAGLRRFIELAGFEIVRRGPVHFQMRGAGYTAPPLSRTNLRALPSEVLYRWGVPHVGFLAVPAGR
jgi:tRNA (mo5U34)-methyltransferase